MRRSGLVAVVMLLATVLVPLSASPASASVVVRAVSTGIGTGAYRPATTRIASGTRVVFRAGSGTHTITSIGANWSFNRTIDANPATATPVKVAFTFRRTGGFRFRCLFHSTLVAGTCSGMCGRVRVN